MEQIPALDPNLVVESIHALEPIPFWNWFQELLELELELESESYISEKGSKSSSGTDSRPES